MQVLLMEDGLLGSWHLGVVVGCTNSHRIVKYAHLLAEDQREKLVEEIPVSAAMQGEASAGVADYRGRIRPLRPCLKVRNVDVRYGLCVDAYVNDAWWEGVVCSQDGGSVLKVFFPDLGDQDMIHIDCLRVTQDWDECSGEWKRRGEWLLIRVLLVLQEELGLPVSIRQIWYDLRSKGSFREKIRGWMFGTEDIWYSFVSELIKELWAVVTCSNVLRVFVPTGPDVIDMPIEEGQVLEDTDIEVPDSNDNNNAKNFVPLEPAKCDYHSLVLSSQMSLDEMHAPSILDQGSLDNLHCPKQFPPSCRLNETDKGPKILSDFIYAYSKKSSSAGIHIGKLRHRARVYLKNNGWKVDKGLDGHTSYLSPDGTCFDSLINACESVVEGNPNEVVNCTDVSSYGKPSARDTEFDSAPITRKAGSIFSFQITESCRRSWTTLTLEPEHCPEAVSAYALRRPSEQKSLQQQVKKHLLALGWKIDFRRDPFLRFRYKSPAGKVYFSLYQVCCDLTEGNQKLLLEDTDGSETDQMGFGKVVSCSMSLSTHSLARNATRDEIRCNIEHACHDFSVFAGQPVKQGDSYCTDGRNQLAEEFGSKVFHDDCSVNCSGLHNNSSSFGKNCVASRKETLPFGNDKDDTEYYLLEAIKNYQNYSKSLRKTGICKVTGVDVKLLRINARECLSNMGWTIRIRRMPSRNEFCYTSPGGKTLSSLTSACKECLRKKSRESSHAKLLEAVNGSDNSNGACDSQFIKSETNNIDSKIFSSSLIHSKKRKVSPSSFQAAAYCGLESHAYGGSICSQPKRRKRSLQPAGFKSESSPNRVLWSFPKHNQVLAPLFSPTSAKTVLSWLIDNSVVLPRQKISYISEKDSMSKKAGRVTREGIRCMCCNGIFSFAKFEAHSGNRTHRPSANIYLDDGRSLLECQMQMLNANKLKCFSRVHLKGDYRQYESDSVCSLCHDVGDLVLCDYCPSSFHVHCVGLQDVPEGKWACPYCVCGICGLSEYNADVQQFTATTKLYCDQCELEYHVGCLRESGYPRLKCSPTGYWLCSNKCSKIFKKLHKLLGKSNSTSVKNLSWTILRWRREDSLGFDKFDRETMAEHHSKLCLALDVLHECFVTVIEPRTRTDLIADILFNMESELNRLRFWGFYTMILERGDELVSVATFRVFGDKVAELPLVGTRIKYRRQGMCRLLLNELQKLLCWLGVENLLLPAVPQLLKTWTTSFGFSKMESSDRLEFVKYPILYFQETAMCQKQLLVPRRKAQTGQSRRYIERKNCSRYILNKVQEIVEPICTLPPSGTVMSSSPNSGHTFFDCMSLTDVPMKPSTEIVDKLSGKYYKRTRKTNALSMAMESSDIASSGVISSTYIEGLWQPE